MLCVPSQKQKIFPAVFRRSENVTEQIDSPLVLTTETSSDDALISGLQNYKRKIKV